MDQPEYEVLPKLHVPQTAVGVPAESFADSTGKIPDLAESTAL